MVFEPGQSPAPQHDSAKIAAMTPMLDNFTEKLIKSVDDFINGIIYKVGGALDRVTDSARASAVDGLNKISDSVSRGFNATVDMAAHPGETLGRAKDALTPSLGQGKMLAKDIGDPGADPVGSTDKSAPGVTAPSISPEQRLATQFRAEQGMGGVSCDAADLGEFSPSSCPNLAYNRGAQQMSV